MLKQNIFSKLFSIKNNWTNVLYIHTPFCLKKCAYCVYDSVTGFSKRDFQRFYRVILPEQIRLFRPILRNTAFREVYFGGGTPTIVSPDILEGIYKSIPGFDKIPVKCSEAHPYTLTDEHIELFGKYRFSYVSLGVQSLSPRILKKNNRFFVPRRELARKCVALQKAGIITNVDLICYLDKGDERDIPQFAEDLSYVMGKLRPVSITIHSNYKSRPKVEKRILLLKTIKKMLGIHREYRRVNSLLSLRNAGRETFVAAEYRLMRDNLSFQNYLWYTVPEKIVYPYNMVSLGAYEKFKIGLMSNIGFIAFDSGSGKYHIVRISDFVRKEHDRIRRQLRLPYEKTRGFFVNEAGKKEFLALSRRAFPGVDIKAALYAAAERI